ncbi:MAG TPA: PadR family transcriptional regulator [Vicinamibacterales bacterium]|nr:PadR family transcriptional regulator [Vicinamibacterales bacterium]
MPTALGEFEQLLLLAVLRLGDEAYGVTIRRAIEDTTGRRVSAGAVYTALGRLENRGFVRSAPGQTTPERTGMRRRYYRVEPEGARQVYRAIRGVQAMADGLLPELKRLASPGPARRS